MNVKYTTANGRLEFQFTSTSDKDVWESLSNIQSLYEIPGCGICDCKILKYIVKRPQAKDGTRYTFFELWCTNPTCRARLEFGQTKDGGRLFAKRKDKNGNYLDHGGWGKWQGTQQQSGSSTGYDPIKGDPPVTDDASIPF